MRSVSSNLSPLATGPEAWPAGVCQHCYCWCPGALAPGHQQPRCWLNTSCARHVEQTNRLTVKPGPCYIYDALSSRQIVLASPNAAWRVATLARPTSPWPEPDIYCKHQSGLYCDMHPIIWISMTNRPAFSPLVNHTETSKCSSHSRSGHDRTMASNVDTWARKDLWPGDGARGSTRRV